MLGMHGTAYANKAVTYCDLILAVGARWDDRITGKLSEFCPDAVKLHIDIDRAEFNKIVRPDVTLEGDARLVVEDLIPLVSKCDSGEWLKQIAAWRKQYPLKYAKKGGLKAQHVLDRLDKLGARDCIVTTDVGQHQMWAAQFVLTTKNRHWLSSGGAGTMGFGVPAAVGRPVRQPRQEGLGHRRRRRLPDDHVRAGHGGAAQAAHQGADHQQPLPGDDPAVAGAVL
jgi:acetolactate synthase-1/2/3 large subunit